MLETSEDLLYSQLLFVLVLIVVSLKGLESTFDSLLLIAFVLFWLDAADSLHMLASHQGLATSAPEELILVSSGVLNVRELDKIEAILSQMVLLLLFAKLIL